MAQTSSHTVSRSSATAGRAGRFSTSVTMGDMPERNSTARRIDVRLHEEENVLAP